MGQNLKSPFESNVFKSPRTTSSRLQLVQNFAHHICVTFINLFRARRWPAFTLGVAALGEPHSHTYSRCLCYKTAADKKPTLTGVGNLKCVPE